MASAVSRTIQFDDLTPKEVALLFCEFSADQQAEFFAAVGREAKDWCGTGWCGQACSIAQHIDDDGRAVIAALADHLAHAEQVA